MSQEPEEPEEFEPAQVGLSRGCTIALIAGFSLAFLITSLVLLLLFLTG